MHAFTEEQIEAVKLEFRHVHTDAEWYDSAIAARLILQARATRDSDRPTRAQYIERSDNANLCWGRMREADKRIAALESENAKLKSKHLEDWGGQVAMMNATMLKLEAAIAAMPARITENERLRMAFERLEAACGRALMAGPGQGDKLVIANVRLLRDAMKGPPDANA